MPTAHVCPEGFRIRRVGKCRRAIGRLFMDKHECTLKAKLPLNVPPGKLSPQASRSIVEKLNSPLHNWITHAVALHQRPILTELPFGY